MAAAFEQLDFIYTPSRDVKAESDHMVEALGAELAWRIEAFGARVALLRLAPTAPAIVLADHLDGEQPILVYRVPDLEQARADLERRGFEPGPAFGIPHGPCCDFRTEGGHRVALYELTRPEVGERFEGRRDF
jgi:hypothetical protein